MITRCLKFSCSTTWQSSMSAGNCFPSELTCVVFFQQVGSRSRHCYLKSLLIQRIKHGNTVGHLGHTVLRGIWPFTVQFIGNSTSMLCHHEKGCISPPGPPFPSLPLLCMSSSRQPPVVGMTVYQGLSKVYPMASVVGKRTCLQSRGKH